MRKDLWAVIKTFGCQLIIDLKVILKAKLQTFYSRKKIANLTWTVISSLKRISVSETVVLSRLKTLQCAQSVFQ